MKPTKNRGWTQLSWKQALFHVWHSSCYSCYKPGDESAMSREQDCEYDKWNIFVVIYNSYIP
jgi:hypothetical protein